MVAPERETVIAVDDLSVDFSVGKSVVHAVEHVSFEIYRGEIMGLVGESGSGKSTMARAINGLLPEAAHVVSGRILMRGEDLLRLSEREWRQVRGNRIAMVFQDALSALNPSMRVGEQVAEAFIIRGVSRRSAHRRAVDLLKLVGIPRAETRADSYPHEFSGGMRQRVVIAAALAHSPDLLIADEPTSALDVTVQAQILQLMRTLRDETGIATLLITHDLGVVAEQCDRVAVMRTGVIVESGSTAEVLGRPGHEYTRMLLHAVPRLDGPYATPKSAGKPEKQGAELEVSGLRVDVSKPASRVLRRQRPVFAVDDVDLSLKPGETLGLVGESGCGKSTLSRAIAGLASVSSGAVRIDGQDVTGLPVGDARRRAVQYVFQDPHSSLNPRRTVRQSIDEARQSRSAPEPEELMDRVQLDRSILERYPGALSGGQRQRVGIARALATEASYLLCDEPVSALDVSIQSRILDLLIALKDDLGIGILFITHDLGVVRQVCDRVAVMFRGRIVETGSVRDIFEEPQHPYTVALLSAIPRIGEHESDATIVLRGEPPAPSDVMPGCRFASRCPIGPEVHPERTRCLEVDPALQGLGEHFAACHFPGERSQVRGDGSVRAELGMQSHA